MDRFISWRASKEARRVAANAYQRRYYNDHLKSLRGEKSNSPSAIKSRKWYAKVGAAYWKKYRSTPSGKLKQYLRTQVWFALKRYGRKGERSSRINDLVGCTFDYLMLHLGSLMKPGMTWDNYGKWHIDHIIPCAAFDLTDLEQQKKCFHYSNLQPLWASENISKGRKITHANQTA